MNHLSSLLKPGETENLDYKKAIFLGLGFFIITASWSLYNSFVPIFLRRFISSETLIGFIMTFDNIAAITLQPYFGALSDNTDTKYGHRLPFLMAGIPIAAIFFALIPFADTFWLLITFLVITNLAMSVFRAPTIALMPDLTPSNLRSKANGVINFMGGIGAVFTFAIGSMLYDIHPGIPFIIFAVFLIGILVLFFLKVREPRKPKERDRIKLLAVINEVIKAEDKKILFVLGAIFFWFFGYSGIETFFTLYGKQFLAIKESAAAFSLTFFSLSFVIFAIPSGFLANKIGRKKTIIMGIIGLILVFSSLIFIRNLLSIRLVLLIGGVFWAFININSYPVIVDSAGNKIGAYTGVYYFFSTIPAILAPIFVGRLIEFFGYPVLFINSVVSFCLALFLMLKVKETVK